VLGLPVPVGGQLEDGRVPYARYRWGELTVGIGDDVDQAIENGLSDDALYADHAGEGLDGVMCFEELRAHLYELVEFPGNLVVENEREFRFDPEALVRLSVRPPREGD
jgi:hypothetical protein